MFAALEASMKDTIIPAVKKFIRITIRENSAKEKDYQVNLVSLLDELNSQYCSQVKAIFAQMEDEMMVKGIVGYSEYTAPKEED